MGFAARQLVTPDDVQAVISSEPVLHVLRFHPSGWNEAFNTSPDHTLCCDHCETDTPAQDGLSEEWITCTACKTAVYCSSKCLEAAAPSHRVLCSKLDLLVHAPARSWPVLRLLSPKGVAPGRGTGLQDFPHDGCAMPMTECYDGQPRLHIISKPGQGSGAQDTHEELLRLLQDMDGVLYMQ